ncbi:MICOS complex subunit mic25-a-like [Glandiceps talaboti]
MGASGSAPKTVTVEMDQEKGTVKISESVVRRMMGEPEPVAKSPAKGPEQSTPQDPKSDEKAAEQLKKREEHWKEKLRQAELKNAELYQLTTEQFTKAAEEVEAKFIHQTYRPICKDLQDEVLQCYSLNPGETLNCAAQVRAFTSCVEETRNNLLTKRDIPGQS